MAPDLQISLLTTGGGATLLAAFYALRRLRRARLRARRLATILPFPGPPPSPDLDRGLALAAEHLESIRVLLEISQAHQQPIPQAALRNLDLVSKNLRQLRLNSGPGPLPPPHSRAAGSHASPSGRSTPSC